MIGFGNMGMVLTFNQLTACLIPFLKAHSAFLKLFLLWYIAPKLRQLVNTFGHDNGVNDAENADFDDDTLVDADGVVKG